MYSVKSAIVISILMYSLPCLAQSVKTKDGVSLGDRNEFIASCTEGIKEVSFEFGELEIESYQYCACICDNVIPAITSWEIDAAISEDDFASLFLKDKNYEIVMNCVQGNVDVKDDYRFDAYEDHEIYMDFGIRACMEEILSNDEADNVFNEDLAYEYCACATIKLYSAGYSYKDLMDIEDQNSEAFNEIVVPCLNDVLNNQTDLNTSNTYDAKDIEGGAYRSLVPLTDYLGLGYKVKISISGISKYYLLDTGASDLLIDRDTERELLLNGTLKRENYLGKEDYVMANNQTVQAQNVLVDHIVIGDYTVNNVVIGILDEGSLLCGVSFLDKFKKWEIDKQNKVLILYK